MVGVHPVLYAISNAEVGGMDLYVRQFGLATHDQFYTNPAILSAFMNFTTQVVSRYVNSPAILSWELANDPRLNNYVENNYLVDPFEILDATPQCLQAPIVQRRPSHDGTLKWRLIFVLLIQITSFPLGECVTCHVTYNCN